MYSILLVDDEKSIREHLTKAIPFERYGFTVSHTALNGREALEKLPNANPDLILLDVRMPEMDGLEFLKFLRQSEYADTQVVMLSGYNEFEYAKEAMKYGVKAYLNKPVDDEEICPLMEKLCGELNNHRKERNRFFIHEHMMMFNKLYNGGNIDRKKFKGYTYMSCVLLHSPYGTGNNHAVLKVQECIAKQLCGIGDYLFRVKGNQFFFLLPPNVLELYAYNKKALAVNLSVELKKEKFECSFLFDSYVFNHKKNTFREDISNHQYEMLTELFFLRGDFMDYYPGKYTMGGKLHLETEYLEDIKQYIESFDKKKALCVVEKLIAAVEKEYVGIQYIQEISYRIYYLIVDEISKIIDFKQSELFLAGIKWLDNTCIITFSKWKEKLYSLVKEGFDFIDQNRSRANLCIVKEIIEYIHLHYMEQISLKQIADIFYVNAAYLGRVFQKTTGINFKKYVNTLRITEAKKLLHRTNKLIYEIANQVGFTESSYFIVKFTQEVGKSPTEFRNELYI